MITVWIQGVIGSVMAHYVAPAVTRAVTKVVPSLPAQHVQSAVEQLFDPNYASLPSDPGTRPRKKVTTSDGSGAR